MAATKIHVVLDALREMFTPLLPDVDVVDAYTFTPAQAAVLVVGMVDTEGVGLPQASSLQVPLPGGSRGRTETVRINCSLTSTPVNESVKDTRDFLVARFDTIDDALRADHSLSASLGNDSPVSEARIGPEVSIGAVDSTSGDAGWLLFTITADVFLT